MTKVTLFQENFYQEDSWRLRKLWICYRKSR